MPPANLTFINHASLKITSGETTVTSDPWISGPAFNNGWRLLVEDDRLGEAAADSKYIWISHEHPDHLSFDFFKRFQPKRSTILFQRTKDGRVAAFFRKAGYSVTEIDNGDSFLLGSGQTLTVGRNGFFDSWSLYRQGDCTILNVNDCDFVEGELETLARQVGPVDVLATQFSYAAWKGGRANRALRVKSAELKLDMVRKQVRALRPRFVIPIASFVYFAHEENSYLNDSVNTVDAFRTAVADTGARMIAMAPGQTWAVGTAWDNDPALRYWQERFASVGDLPLEKTGAAVPVETLRASYDTYRRRVGEKNSLPLMELLARLPALGAFRPFVLKLTDVGKVVRFSFWDGLEELPPGTTADVEMTSESLNFIFLNEFGYDTLTVNARFEAGKGGFAKMTKNLAIGSLNTMGLRLSLGFVKDLDVALLLLKKMSRFVKKLA